MIIKYLKNLSNKYPSFWQTYLYKAREKTWAAAADSVAVRRLARHATEPAGTSRMASQVSRVNNG